MGIGIIRKRGGGSSNDLVALFISPEQSIAGFILRIVEPGRRKIGTGLGVIFEWPQVEYPTLCPSKRINRIGGFFLL